MTQKALMLSAALISFVSLATPPILAEYGVFESFGAHTLPSAKTPVGPTEGGFALSITADAPTVRLGSPIWVTVELRPISDQGAKVEYGSRHSSYVFTIMRQPNETVAPAIPNTFGLAAISGPWCGRAIPAGHSTFGRFQLDEMYAITKPGTYSISVLGRPVIDCKPVMMQSNSITVTVQP